jgi:hypothetical protein
MCSSARAPSPLGAAATGSPLLAVRKRGYSSMCGVGSRRSRQGVFKRRFAHPGPHPMRIFDPAIRTPTTDAAITDRLICADVGVQGLAADVRLLNSHTERRSFKDLLQLGSTTLFDCFTSSRREAVSHCLLYMSSRDFWGLGVDSTGLAVPPTNQMVLAAVQRLLHESSPSRDRELMALPTRRGVRRYADEYFDWGSVEAETAEPFSLSTGVLYVGQECAAWYDLVGGASYYRPIRLDVVRYHPGLNDARYVVTFVFLDDADLGSLVMDLAASEIDTESGRLLTSIHAVRSCWSMARQLNEPPSSPFGVVNAPVSRTIFTAAAPPRVDDAPFDTVVSPAASVDSTRSFLRACAPTPGGTCASPLSVSSGDLECPGAPLRVSSLSFSCASLDVVSYVDASDIEDPFAGVDAYCYTEEGVDENDYDILLGADLSELVDEDLQLPPPPPLMPPSPSSTASSLVDDDSLVPLWHSAVHQMRMSLPTRSASIWCVAPPPLCVVVILCSSPPF